MRFSTIALSFLSASSSTLLFVAAQSAAGHGMSDALVVRDNGDTSVFQGRDITSAEIFERDAAYSAATGEGLLSRDFLGEDEINEIVARHLAEDIEARELAVELEERAAPAMAARLVVQGIKKVVDVIKGVIAKDKTRRGKFTSEFISKSRAKYPQFNWVICHTKHTTKFNGVRGKDWAHRHEEFNVSFGKTVGYEIYWFKSGTFTRHGDGGYLNWAYGGKIKSKSKDGKTITFS